MRDALCESAEVRARLVPLLGASSALGEHLVAHGADWQAVVGEFDAAGMAARLALSVGADPDDPVTGTAGARATVTGTDAVIALQAAYRRELVAIAGRDLAGAMDLREVTQALADLAGHTLQAALSVAATGLAEPAVPCRLAIVAMGKAGGRELNYVSDVDVVFVAEPGDRHGPAADVDRALVNATYLAGYTMRICRDVAWEVDAALRPEGKDGPLVRTLASHEAYYKRWASTWEFQALLKARPVAGDLDLGRSLRRDHGTDGVECGRAAGLRRRRAGHAPPGRRPRAGRGRRPGDQARPRRAARRRVRRAVAATRARPRR